MPHDAMAA
jgi:hypothetical protein